MRYLINPDSLRVEINNGYELVFEAFSPATYRLTRVKHAGQLVMHGMFGPLEVLNEVWAGGAHGNEEGRGAYLYVERDGSEEDFDLGAQNTVVWRDADALTLRTHASLRGLVERRVEHRITPSTYRQVTTFETVRAHAVNERYADMVPLVRPEWTDWGAVSTSVSNPPHTSGVAEVGAEVEFRGPGRSVTVVQDSSVIWYWSASSADKYKIYAVASGDTRQPGETTRITSTWVFK